MSVVDRKLGLLENIARLRRVGRKLPGNRDLTAVRAALEDELGETVSRRIAARLLGVSHAALDRWVDAGDVSVVYSPGGRLEVPVPELLELYEAVETQRDAGPRRYALTTTMTRRRDAALALDDDDLLQDHGPRSSHERARARSLAYHRVLARRLRKPMVDEARHVLFRWRRQGRIDPRYADRWAELLECPVAEIRRALREQSQDADDLRQNSPFAGMLSEPERRRILREVT